MGFSGVLGPRAIIPSNCEGVSPVGMPRPDIATVSWNKMYCMDRSSATRLTCLLIHGAPLLNRLGVEARIAIVLFGHDLLFIRRGDSKETAACQWRIGSLQSAIDDCGQVNGAVARVHAGFHPAVEPGQRLGQERASGRSGK